MTRSWIAEYRHEDGRTETAAITAVSLSGAKVAARNGEHDGFKFVRVSEGA